MTSSFSLIVKMVSPSTDLFQLCVRNFALISSPSSFSTNPILILDADVGDKDLSPGDFLIVKFAGQKFYIFWSKIKNVT